MNPESTYPDCKMYPDWSKKADPKPFEKITSVGDPVLLFSSKQIDSLITYMEGLEEMRDDLHRGFSGRRKLPRDLKDCKRYIDAWFKTQVETGKSVLEIEFAEPEVA